MRAPLSWLFGVLAICMMCGASAFAAPDEIQVYTEELNDPGQFGLEQHLNYTIQGTQTRTIRGR